MSTPEEIQTEIERTRASLSQDVDRLGEKVSPGKVVGRRVDRVKGSVTSVRDRVMGSSDDGSGLQGTASSARDTVASATSSIGDAASNAPQTVRRQTQGNPLAAGLIAFGTGWLLASLAPATSAEKEVARRAEDKATDLAEPLKQHAQQAVEQLKEPAQQAVEQVKSTATDAVSETTDQAKSKASDVREPMTR